MKILSRLLLATVVLMGVGCASHPAHPDRATAKEPEPEQTIFPESPSPRAPASQVGGIGMEDVPAPAAVEAVTMPTRADTEDAPDASALYDGPVVRDPWEGYNRRMHRFNNGVDRYFLRPIAVGYTRVIPEPVRHGVSRFFDNLAMPASAINQLLQGHPAHAMASLGRFAVNTTLGVGGVFDPAARMGLRRRDEEDVGQTLAIWGWRDSRYLVLPLLGPRTVRDAFALVADRKLSPLAYVDDGGTAMALQLLGVVDGRAGLMRLDELRREAYDDYAFVRDAWVQRRNHRIDPDPPER